MSVPAMRILMPVLLLSVLVGAGCGVKVPSKPYPEKRHYVLDPARPADAPEPDVEPAGPLTVRAFDITPRFGDSLFVYRVGPLQFKADFYNQWLRAPASLITEEVRRWFTRGELFGPVVEPSSGILTRYVLEGTIGSLYGDFAGKTPEAVLSIQIYLLKYDDAGPKAVWHRVYEERRPLEAAQPDLLVHGWNNALTQILLRLETDVAELLDESSDASPGQEPAANEAGDAP